MKKDEILKNLDNPGFFKQRTYWATGLEWSTDSNRLVIKLKPTKVMVDVKVRSKIPDYKKNWEISIMKFNKKTGAYTTPIFVPYRTFAWIEGSKVKSPQFYDWNTQERWERLNIFNTEQEAKDWFNSNLSEITKEVKNMFTEILSDLDRLKLK